MSFRQKHYKCLSIYCIIIFCLVRSWAEVVPSLPDWDWIMKWKGKKKEKRKRRKKKKTKHWISSKPERVTSFSTRLWNTAKERYPLSSTDRWEWYRNVKAIFPGASKEGFEGASKLLQPKKMRSWRSLNCEHLKEVSS